MIVPRLAITAIVLIAVALLLVRLPGKLEAAPASPPAKVSDEILVKFSAHASESSIQALNRSEGTTQVDTIPEIGVRALRVTPGTDPAKVASRYADNPNVEYAEPDYIASVVSTPNDPYFTGGFQWNMTKVQAPQAWDITKGSPSVSVAILDTGVDLSHPDLQGKVVASVNFSDSATTTDVNGHGTHVAGIAGAATNNGAGVAGLGYNTTVMNVKVLGDNGTGGYGWVAQGIVWATDHGAKVINMSLGAQFGSTTLEDAINYAWDRGVVVVAGAGNDASSTPFYPAAYPNVIAVASTDTNDRLASSSDYGDWVDVAAPGANIYSTLNLDNVLQPGGYGVMGGTSMASPHVVGLAALVFTRVTDSNGDGLLNDEVRSCIEQNADNIGISGIGSGRINAYRAVQCTSGPATTSPTPTPAATSTPAATATPTQTPTPSPTRSPTASATLSPSPSPAPTPPPSPVPTPTPTPSPVSSATPTPTPSPTPSPTVAPTPTPTATPTSTPSPTVAPTPTPTATPTSTPSPTVAPTLTPMLTPTSTPTPAPSDIPTSTPALTPTPTATPPSSGDTTRPQVALQQPGTGQTVKGSISMSATASDNVGVVNVSFYIDGVLYKTDTSAPYAASWRSRKWSNGLHTIIARAYDAARNMSEDTHTITVQN